MKLIKQDRLHYSMCDTAANLSALGAFHMVEDAITELFGLLRLDGEVCVKEYDGMWIYARNRIEIRHPVHWMDEFILECYISSIGGAKIIVDTVIKSKNHIAVASRAELCAIDRQTSRVRRANTVGVDDTITAENPEIDIKFNKDTFVPSQIIDSVVVRSSDIDFYHHTNNIAYVRYLVNQFTMQEQRQKPLTEIEIRYVNQTFEGDKLDIYRCSENCFTIQNGDKSVVNCWIA